MVNKLLIVSVWIISFSLISMELPEKSRPHWKKSIKRSSQEDEEPHFLIRQPRRKLSPMLVPEVSQPQGARPPEIGQNVVQNYPLKGDENNVVIEEVILPFDCKYRGMGGCDRQFIDKQKEWEHICRFHGIIAARYDQENSIMCDFTRANEPEIDEDR